MDPKEKAQQEQHAAAFRDALPNMVPGIRAFYVACIDEGFNPTEAIKLTVAVVQSMIPGGQ